MSAALQGVLLVAAALFCLPWVGAKGPLTINPDTPEYVRAANYFREHLKSDLEPLIESIQSVRSVVEDVCWEGATADTQVAAPPGVGGPIDADLSSKLLAIEGQVNNTLRKMETLEAKLEEKIGELATAKDLKELREALETTLEETVRMVERQVSGMATQAEVEEVVKTEMERVKEAVEEVQETCGNDATVTELLRNVVEVNDKVEEVKEQTQALDGKVGQWAGQEAVEVRGVGEKLEEIGRKVALLHGVVEEELGNVAGQIDVLHNTTQHLIATPPPPPPTEEDPSEPIYPCLDSTFVGSKRGKICYLAVRFHKCQMPVVAYHCCQTCTRNGQLPEMGPWRHQLLPRQVATLDVLRFFSP